MYYRELDARRNYFGDERRKIRPPVLTPALALVLAASSAVTFAIFSAQLAARQTAGRFQGPRVLHKWLEKEARGSWADVLVMTLGGVGLVMLWVAVALNESQPGATRMIGVLHTLAALGWTGYVVYEVFRRS